VRYSASSDRNTADSSVRLRTLGTCAVTGANRGEYLPLGQMPIPYHGRAALLIVPIRVVSQKLFQSRLMKAYGHP
jgi:hypothetical protein